MVVQAEHKLSDVVDQQVAEGNSHGGLPRRAEMLNILARYDTSLLN
jgi:hypothetical protein